MKTLEKMLRDLKIEAERSSKMLQHQKRCITINNSNAVKWWQVSLHLRLMWINYRFKTLAAHIQQYEDALQALSVKNFQKTVTILDQIIDRFLKEAPKGSSLFIPTEVGIAWELKKFRNQLIVSNFPA